MAELALRKLGLQESVGSFAAATTVSVVTDRVLLITVSAPSSSAAVSRANAVAAAFLQFRASQMETAQQLLLKSLTQEVGQARQNVASINSQISQLSAQPTSSAQQSQLKNLRTQLDQANGQLAVDEQTLEGNKVEHGHPVGGDGQRGARPCRSARALATQVPAHLRCHRARRGPGPGSGHCRGPDDRVRPAAPARRRYARTRRTREAQRRPRAAQPVAAGSARAGGRQRHRRPADRRAPARCRAGRRGGNRRPGRRSRR